MNTLSPIRIHRPNDRPTREVTWETGESTTSFFQHAPTPNSWGATTSRLQQHQQTANPHTELESEKGQRPTQSCARESERNAAVKMIFGNLIYSSCPPPRRPDNREVFVCSWFQELTKHHTTHSRDAHRQRHRHPL